MSAVTVQLSVDASPAVAANAGNAPAVTELKAVVFHNSEGLHVASGKAFNERLNELLALLSQTVRAFVAERTALGVTTEHALGHLDEEQLLECLDEMTALRGSVPVEDRENFTRHLLAVAPHGLLDGEVIAALLGVEVEEGVSLLARAGLPR